jgi:hypothetical protein
VSRIMRSKSSNEFDGNFADGVDFVVEGNKERTNVLGLCEMLVKFRV